MPHQTQTSKPSTTTHYIDVPGDVTEQPLHTTQEKFSKLCKTFGVTVAAAGLQTISQCSSVLLINAVDPVFKPHLMLEVIAMGHLEVSGLIIALANINQIPKQNPDLSELFITVFGTCMLMTGIAGITIGEFTLNSPLHHAYFETDDVNHLPFQCHQSTTYPYPHCENKGSTEDFYKRLSGFGFGTSICIPLFITIGCGIITLALACKNQTTSAAHAMRNHVKNSLTYLRNSASRVSSVQEYAENNPGSTTYLLRP